MIDLQDLRARIIMPGGGGSVAAFRRTCGILSWQKEKTGVSWPALMLLLPGNMAFGMKIVALDEVESEIKKRK